MIFIAAWWIGAIPLLWLGLVRWRGESRGPAWWWLGIAFGISWLADAIAFLGLRFAVSPDLVGNVYPLSQAAVVGAVLLDRDDALVFTAALVVTGIVAVLWHGPLGVDVLLSTVASLSAAGIAYKYKAIGRVRWSLLVTFGVGWACWMAYAAFPGWWSWSVYQGVRLAGILLFCWAALDPKPRFALSRRTL